MEYVVFLVNELTHFITAHQNVTKSDVGSKLNIDLLKLTQLSFQYPYMSKCKTVE